jgi:mono/diheme cytochrome c family protein
MKSRYILLGSALGLGLMFFPPAVSSAPGGSMDHPSSDRGMQVFQAYCVACHGTAGTGNGPMASALVRDFGIRPSDLTAPKFMTEKKSDEQLKVAVKGGGKAVHRSSFMPAWGQSLTEHQVGDLVAYIRELQIGTADIEATIPNLGDRMELGRVLYTTRCQVCHGMEGKGDGPFMLGIQTGEMAIKGVSVPDMSTPGFFSDSTDKQLAELIQNGSKHAGVGLQSSTWWDRKLQPEEVEDLILYLRALPMSEKPRRS